MIATSVLFTCALAFLNPLSAADCPPDTFPFVVRLPPQWVLITCESLSSNPELWSHPAILALPTSARNDWLDAIQSGKLRLFARNGKNKEGERAVVYIVSFSSGFDTSREGKREYCKRIEKNLHISSSGKIRSEVLHGCFEKEVAGYSALYVETSNPPEATWEISYSIVLSDTEMIVFSALVSDAHLETVRGEFDSIMESLSVSTGSP